MMLAMTCNSTRLQRDDSGSRGTFLFPNHTLYMLFSSVFIPVVYVSPDSSHPYIFFNQDRMSITFVGFMVTPNGDLMDPKTNEILEHAIMTSRLYTGLKQNRVNFDDDYRNWSKDIMIQKLGMVMGLEFVYDPDETYVLTVDNVIKMLAIQMRFRWAEC